MAGATRWASQAAQDALLRYNPQRSALAQQIREAHENYGSTVRAGRVTAKETERSTQRALPLLAQIFSGAKAAQGAGATLLSQDLANIPGVNPNLKAGAAQEVQQQIANEAQAGASAQAMMLERGTRAREGAQFAQTNAQQVLTRTLSQLFSKGRDIAGEQGAFAQSEAEKLAAEAEDREQSERQSERTAATAEAGSKRTREGTAETNQTKRDTAGGAHEIPPEGQQKAAHSISQMAGYARTLFGEGLSRQQAVERLSKAEPSISHKAKSGDTIHVPGRGAYAPDVLMSAALDAASSNGYISKTTLGRLHAAKYSVKQLGLKGVKPQPQGIAGHVQKALEGLY